MRTVRAPSHDEHAHELAVEHHPAITAGAKSVASRRHPREQRIVVAEQIDRAQAWSETTG
jgi:hypothetical protein